MLSTIYNDLIGEYEAFQTAKDMWNQLKFDFGGTSTARLRSLVLKFEVHRKDPKHTMTEHLRMMYGMISTSSRTHVLLFIGNYLFICPLIF